jgi:hypothetical protein
VGISVDNIPSYPPGGTAMARNRPESDPTIPRKRDSGGKAGPQGGISDPMIPGREGAQVFRAALWLQGRAKRPLHSTLPCSMGVD